MRKLDIDAAVEAYRQTLIEYGKEPGDHVTHYTEDGIAVNLAILKWGLPMWWEAVHSSEIDMERVNRVVRDLADKISSALVAVFAITSDNPEDDLRANDAVLKLLAFDIIENLRAFALTPDDVTHRTVQVPLTDVGDA